MKIVINRKFYKSWLVDDVTGSNIRSIFPGDLRVARCFSLSDHLLNVCSRFVKLKAEDFE